MTALTASAVKAYAETGFLHVPGVLEAGDVEHYIEAWRVLWDSIDLEQSPAYVHWRDRTDGTRIADRIDPVRNLSAEFRALCDAPAVRELAEQLLGGPVFVMKDKLITKQPGTRGYGAHQDMPYWEESGLQADEVLTAAIALDHVTDLHGPLELFAEQHHSRLPTDDSDLDLSEAALRSLKAGQTIEMAAGDVVYFHSLTPHRSATNTAMTPRRMYLITYARDRGNSAEARRGYTGGLARVHSAHQQEKPS